MEKLFQILVNKNISETLNTRDSATLLFDIILHEDAKNVVFDFSNVVFMSRSFADQFHKERMKLKDKKGLFIQIKNASDEVRKMLVTVENTQSKKNRFYRELPVFTFSEDNMEAYLFAL